MNWAKERAERIMQQYGYSSIREPLANAIAAELQRVADECAETAASAPANPESGQVRGSTMRITMKREKEKWGPRMYSIKVDGAEVGTIQRDRTEEKWFWYARADGAHCNTWLRRENRFFPSAKAALEDFKAWRKSL